MPLSLTEKIGAFAFTLTAFGLGRMSSKLNIFSLIRRASKEQHKMVLVVRTDIKMGAGKMAAQCAHAAVASVQGLDQKSLDNWMAFGQPKIVVRCDSEQTLNTIEDEARKAGIHTSSIRDAGRTQLVAGTKTTLAVGPGPESHINNITGKLKLL